MFFTRAVDVTRRTTCSAGTDASFFPAAVLVAPREEHDVSVCQIGVYDRAVAAIAAAKRARVSHHHAQLHIGTAKAERVAGILRRRHGDGRGRDFRLGPATPMSVRARSAALPQSPQDQGFGGRLRAPRERTGSKKWSFNQSSMFLDFLAGNQSLSLHAVGNPTRTYFGWQRPCYLLGEAIEERFKELMEETDPDSYGTGNYEKCAHCMVHSNSQATAVSETVGGHGKRRRRRCGGLGQTSAMAPDIPLDRQRPADYVFSRHVEQALTRRQGARAGRSRRRVKSPARTNDRPSPLVPAVMAGLMICRRADGRVEPGRTVKRWSRRPCHATMPPVAQSARRSSPTPYPPLGCQLRIGEWLGRQFGAGTRHSRSRCARSQWYRAPSGRAIVELPRQAAPGHAARQPDIGEQDAQPARAPTWQVRPLRLRLPTPDSRLTQFVRRV